MAQIDALLARAKATDDAEVGEPELDLPAEIERRNARLAAIRQARERLQQRQREADLQPWPQRRRPPPSWPGRPAGASLMEGGWRVRSNTLQPPRGGGSGEPCEKPQARRLRGFCCADAYRCYHNPGVEPRFHIGRGAVRWVARVQGSDVRLLAVREPEAFSTTRRADAVSNNAAGRGGPGGASSHSVGDLSRCPLLNG